MQASDCVSISELKKSPSQVIKSLQKDKMKYIFVNNKPQAMIIDFEMWSELGIDNALVDFWIISKNNISDDAATQLNAAKNTKKSDFIDF